MFVLNLNILYSIEFIWQMIPTLTRQVKTPEQVRADKQGTNAGGRKRGTTKAEAGTTVFNGDWSLLSYTQVMPDIWENSINIKTKN